jgi:hypothetical protein
VSVAAHSTVINFRYLPISIITSQMHTYRQVVWTGGADGADVDRVLDGVQYSS